MSSSIDDDDDDDDESTLSDNGLHDRYDMIETGPGDRVSVHGTSAQVEGVE